MKGSSTLLTGLLASALMALSVSGSGQTQAPGPSSPAVALTSADAYTRLSTLNSERKFKAPLFGEVDYTGLKQENCFGVDIGAGTRLVGESGGNYGLEFIRKDQPTKTAIGLISIEGAVSIGGRPVPAGEYVVFAAPQALSFLTEPSDQGVEIPLTVAIPESRLGRKAADRPRFEFTVESGAPSLVIAGNALPIRRSGAVHQTALRVASARRTMEYQTVDMRKLRPADETRDVLLVIDLEGITVEDFQKLQPKDIHIDAGGQRHETVMTGAGLVNGKTEIHILFNIPKTLLDMQLIVGAHSAVTFTAAKTIEPSIGRSPNP